MKMLKLKYYILAVAIFLTGLNFSAFCGSEDYKKPFANFASNMVTSALFAGLGFLAYKGSEKLAKELLNSSLIAKLPDKYRTDEIKKWTELGIKGSLASSITMLGVATTYKTINNALYMLFSGTRLSPSFAQQALNELNLYLVYLTILDNIEKEFNSLIHSLDSQKYHQAVSAQRLNCLDGAFYHLKNHNLIANLEKERNFHTGCISTFVNKLQFFVDEESKQMKCLKALRENYNKFVSSPTRITNNEALTYLQEQESLDICEDLSEFYTHVKLFNKGFNEGINVIDEACKINDLASSLLDVISYHLWDHHKALIKLLADCSQNERLENMLKKINRAKN